MMIESPWGVKTFDDIQIRLKDSLFSWVAYLCLDLVDDVVKCA